MVAHRDLDDGMVRIEAVLHPEEAAVVRAAIEREPATLPRKPRTPRARPTPLSRHPFVRAGTLVDR